MTALAIILTATLPLDWSEPTPVHITVETGYATYMRPGLMDDVVRNRGITVPEGWVPVALNRKGDLARRVWLLWPSHPDQITLAFVVDCAQEQHYPGRLAQDRDAEVPAWLAQDLGFYGIGPIPVEVWYVPPWAVLDTKYQMY